MEVEKCQDRDIPGVEQPPGLGGERDPAAPHPGAVPAGTGSDELRSGIRDSLSRLVY